MNRDLSALIEQFSRLRVLVIGEAMLDSYSRGPARRICPEAPAPVVEIRSRQDFAGGAANAAMNAAALGARTSLLSATGDDAEAMLLKTILDAAGVSTKFLFRRASRTTLSKHRVLAGSQVVVRMDRGATAPLDASSEAILLDALDSLAPRCDAVLVSDYGYGVLTPRVIERLIELKRRHSWLVAVDSKDLPRFRELRPTIVKPNYREACVLLGSPAAECGDNDFSEDRFAALSGRGDEILQATGAQIAAVTLDSEGAILFERGRRPRRAPARAVNPAQPSGAGDTFLATFAAALAAAGEIGAATELAAAAASIVVAKENTAVCTPAELREAFAEESRPAVDLERLIELADDDRRRGRRIVLTNGCFDILHRGHIAYLHRAKRLGDVLIVGVNSDDSIRRLKGDSRPVNCLEDRLRVLAALSCVDRLIVFHEDAPHKLIQAVRPDVFVKGGDYSRETLPEAELVEAYGGRVELLPFIAGRSTTRLIDRIIESRAATPPFSSSGAADHALRVLDRRQEPVVR